MTAPDVVTEMFAAYRTSLDSLEGKLGNAFSDAVDLLEEMSGTVVVCGMGKSDIAMLSSVQKIWMMPSTSRSSDSTTRAWIFASSIISSA